MLANRRSGWLSCGRSSAGKPSAVFGEVAAFGVLRRSAESDVAGLLFLESIDSVLDTDPPRFFFRGVLTHRSK